MTSTSVSAIYERAGCGYNSAVPAHFTIGDVIERERTRRKWSQTRLGIEAMKYRLSPNEQVSRINKSTVSKVERDPYTSELITVWRLVAALGLTMCEVEGRMGQTPFHVVDPPLERRPVAKKRVS